MQNFTWYPITPLKFRIKLPKIFKTYNLDIVSSINNNFLSLLGITKDKDKSNNYNMQYKDSDKCYIGQINRKYRG